MVSLALLAVAWQLALPGWQYEFPRDHRKHPGFKTEWWYFTGNLQAADGREFGYQLTFFRQGIAPEPPKATSRFVTSDIKFAHFTITDLARKKFHFGQMLSRGAYGEAGFGDERIAWIDQSKLRLEADGNFHLVGRDGDRALDLRLVSQKPPAIHGADGFSRKGEGEGRASHYYSLTRLKTSGTLTLGGEVFAVTGQSWFDHEWATNQLAPGQVGWDWFSLQFDDGTELMLFQIRTKSGGRDPWSSGSFIARDGSVTAIANEAFDLEPSRAWTSPHTGGRYPLVWRITVPKLGVDVTVEAKLDDQELQLQPVAYWEGAVRARGKRNNRSISGSGYLEMTGYAGDVVGLNAER